MRQRDEARLDERLTLARMNEAARLEFIDTSVHRYSVRVTPRSTLKETLQSFACSDRGRRETMMSRSSKGSDSREEAKSLAAPVLVNGSSWLSR